MDNSLRKEIDIIDEQIVELFSERMNVVKRIAEYKRNNNLPILDADREKEKLEKISESTSEAIKDYVQILYSVIFCMSRTYQHSVIEGKTEIGDSVIHNIVNSISDI